jgi:hypothetical protein
MRQQPSGPYARIKGERPGRWFSQWRSKQPDALTLLLCKMRKHARRGFDPRGWSEDDYAVIDGQTCIGRIYKEIIHGEPKLWWFLQTVPAPLPNQGMADTLEEAKVGFKKRYAGVKGRKWPDRWKCGTHQRDILNPIHSPTNAPTPPSNTDE